MEMEEQHLKVSRTARYFTYGNAGPGILRVWFVLHGYGQLASSVLKRFSSFNPETDFVVAPEGLSRFYWEGFGGKPVASWMTSADRLHEIADYVAYLNQLYQQVSWDLLDKHCRMDRVEVNVLGFSQGTATTARWLADGSVKIDQVIFWAGPLPEDVDWEAAKPIFNASRAVFLLGDQDPFMKFEHFDHHKKKLEELGLNFDFIPFEGAHDIEPDGLDKLWKHLYKESLLT